jgi:hypothetical protein
MIKFVVSNENLYLRLLRLPLGKYFFLLNIKKFQAIRNTRSRESFLSQFILPNKTLKSTSNNRFKDLNEIIFKYIDPGKKQVVHDIAVSDGLASLELYNELSAVCNNLKHTATSKSEANAFDSNESVVPDNPGMAAFDSHESVVSDKPGMAAFDSHESGKHDKPGLNTLDNPEFYISDKYSKFFISNGCITRIYSADYTLMHFYLFNFLYADNKISNWFFLSKILFHILNLIPVRSVAPLTQMTEIKLYNGKVIDALDTGKIHELEYDVLHTRTDRKFTFIRAMNILNRIYFTEEEILRALGNILYTLEENGLLLSGRTSKSVNHVTFYRKVNSRLVILETVNNGSDTDDQVSRLNEPKAEN